MNEKRKKENETTTTTKGKMDGCKDVRYRV